MIGEILFLIAHSQETKVNKMNKQDWEKELIRRAFKYIGQIYPEVFEETNGYLKSFQDEYDIEKLCQY